MPPSTFGRLALRFKYLATAPKTKHLISGCSTCLLVDFKHRCRRGSERATGRSNAPDAVYLRCRTCGRGDDKGTRSAERRKYLVDVSESRRQPCQRAVSEQHHFPIGQYSRVQDVLNIQPVIPITLNNDWLLITRWITPVVYQPNIDNRIGGANGLGDINPSFFLSPARPGKLIWGIGPTFLFPTATDPTLGQQMGCGSFDRFVSTARALDDRLPIEQHLVLRGRTTSSGCESVPYAVFHHVQSQEPLVLNGIAHPHVRLDGTSAQQVACTIRRRLWEDYEVRYPADRVAGQSLLQLDSSARHSIPQMASSATSGVLVSERKIMWSRFWNRSPFG